MCGSRALDPTAVAERCLAGGATLLQLRQKAGSTAAFLEWADRIVRLAAAHQAQVIVNDRADLAALSGAHGVHVGQEDLSVREAFTVAGPGAIVGLSTHTRAQIDVALAGAATYVAVGPVFDTATKATGYEARGLELVSYAAGRGKPIVGIGGITLATAPDVSAAGASAVAVITDLLSDGDVERRVRAFVSILPARQLKV